MSTKSHIAASKKFRTGPAGIRCACCAPWCMSARKAKPQMRRYFRHVAKNALRAEVSK